MYAIRTPTDSEVVEKFAGFILVVASAISLGVAMAFILYGTHPVFCHVVTPTSAILLWLGFDVVGRDPRQSIHFLPLLIVACICIFLSATSGATGLKLLAGLGLINAYIFVPTSWFMYLASLRAWCYAEEATSGKRKFAPIDVNPGVTFPQDGDYAQRFREAQEFFDNARVRIETRLGLKAELTPQEWRFGRAGASADALTLLNKALNQKPRREFQILMILVSAFPDDWAQPALIMITGDRLDRVKVDCAGIEIDTVDFERRIPAELMRGLVTFR